MTNHRKKPATADDAGYALIAVIIMVAILITIALIAFAETGQSRVGTSQSSTSSAADAAANAGMAAMLYNIETGNFCTVEPVNQLQPNQSPTWYSLPMSTALATYAPNAPAESYELTSENFFASYGPPLGTALSCSAFPGSVAGVPGAATLTVKGQAQIGGITTDETITDEVFITQMPQAYAALQSGSGSLSLSNVIVQQSSSSSALGEIYSNGSMSSLTGGACPAGNVVVTGSWSDSDNCTIGGSVVVNGGSLSLSNNAVVSGSVTVTGGNVYLTQGATVNGDVFTSGNIYLCPGSGSSPPSGCPTNAGGNATIQGSADANGTIQFANVQEGTSAPFPPCNTATTLTVGGSKDTVDGCVYATYPQEIQPLGGVSFPSFSDPSTWANWANPSIPCVDNNNTSLISDITAAGTTKTVITLNTVGNCTGGYTISKPIQLANGADIAIWAPCGLTISGTGQFKLAAGATAAQVVLISGSQTASCGSGATMVGDISTVNNNPFQNGISALLAAAGNFTISGNVNITGEVLANQISGATGGNKLTITYSAYTPPGMVFGYQAVVKQRYISQI